MAGLYMPGINRNGLACGLPATGDGWPEGMLKKYPGGVLIYADLPLPSPHLDVSQSLGPPQFHHFMHFHAHGLLLQDCKNICFFFDGFWDDLGSTS